MVDRGSETRLTFEQYFFSGCVAGFVSKTLTAPLDVLKVRTQVGTAETHLGYRNAVAILYSNEGWRSFWKGNLIGCIRMCPHSIVQLTAFHQLKLKLADDCGRLTPWTAGIAGAGGGITAAVALYPTDTVKTRLIVQPNIKGFRHYTGIFDAFRTIVREEGFLALYRGLSTTLLAVIPYSAATFWTYHWLSCLCPDPQLQEHQGFVFFQGCLAAAVSQFTTFPFDTIRKKMQAWNPILEAHNGIDVKAKTMRHAIRETYHLYGVPGFWRGCLPTMIRITPYTGLMFVVYELCRRVWMYYNGYTLSLLKAEPHPLVDQTMKPFELWDLSDEGNSHWEGMFDDGQD